MRKPIHLSCRLLSWVLIFAALLSFMPAVANSTVSAAGQEVTVYFYDADGWGNVNGYAWDTAGNLLGEWPGTALTKGTNGLYAMKVTVSGGFSFIFNNGTSQTGDLSLTAAQVSSGAVWCVSGASGKPAKYAPPSFDGGKVTFTYTGSGTNVYVAGSFNGWSASANKMTKSGGVFTCTLDLAPGRYEYKLVKDGSWINDPGNPMVTGSDHNNFFIMPGMADTTVYAAPGETTSLPAELPCTIADGSTVRKAVTYTMSAVSGVTLSGNKLTVSSGCTASKVTLTAATADGHSCTVTANLSTADLTKADVTIHFINSLGWDGVCAYVWSSGSTLSDAWPGRAVQRDADGGFTLNLTHRFAAGETLGLLLHNNKGSQTTDITVTNAQLKTGKVELWVQPAATANAEGKFPATVTTSKAAQFISTEIKGNQVTFRYKGSASAVYLAGTFNNWSKTANKMTKSGGVFSTTVTLSPGIHEYKLIVDGEWICDPGNGLAGGYDGNSILVVPSGEEPVNTGKITVKLHFYRGSGAYTGWDVWYWGAETSNAAALSTVSGDKGRVATFTVDGNRNSNVGYVVRKSDWTDKEFYDRFIDLSDICSGTVHYFLNSGSAQGSRILDSDVVMASKITYANIDYTTGKIAVNLSMPFEGALSSAFSLSGPDSTVKITGVETSGSTIYLSLTRKLKLSELPNYKIVFNATNCAISTDGLFYSAGFAADYTYHGDDLGANYSPASTTFKVWAPTARNVHLKLYKSGNYGTNDQLQYIQMKQGDKGVWYVTVTGDLHGKYYNYDITFDTYTTEATDPYAKACGANGDRGMIVDLDATDPAGWNEDISPNRNMSYTDAIIYEMHIREMTIDSSSGVKDAWKGKYLGLTQDGTNYNGYATGLAHLKELGVTHVQLMPTFDFNSVDEYHLSDWKQYAWGYDPKNYNVPEGGYATDPFNGTTRISEFKTMVHTFHENGINVVMDVVYNHTFDGGNYCGNKIVPNYYSRFFGEGNWSNGSGVGNDFATERSMVRNLIVDSVYFWVEEYHIDGFRFDLAGLIDTQTINEIVNTVHAKYPNVMFYGEGWAPGGTAVEYGYSLATKDNAWQTPGFAHFNDNFRNDIAGSNGSPWGFTVGDGGKADAIGNYFRASNGWSGSPSQTINYVSCHDNYCLMDKIILSQDGRGTSWENMVRMGNLSNAIVMMAQGIPFIYSGEELLREKKDASGNRYDNAYGTDDYINKIRWSDLKSKTYAQMTDDYYAGLIAFRKNHAALRCPGGSDAWNYTSYHKVNDQTLLFNISGYPNYECSDGIVIIYNASTTTQYVNLYNYGVPSGTWNACVHGTQAGIRSLWSMEVTGSSGTVGVEPLSATILVKGDLVDENSVYNQNLALVQCKHPKHNTAGSCTTCGVAVEHSWSNNKCSICGKAALAITKQPVSVTVASGKTASVSVTATGEGLTYAWYYKNPGTNSFVKSTGVTGNTYSVAMNASRSGRQLYCVITDQYGNSLKTNTVTLSMTAASVAITKQPVSVSVASGQTATVSFAATGDGLTYKWYYKNKGASSFTRTTTFSGNTYTAQMNASRDGRQIYCVVTDKYGNSVKTDVVTISMKKVAITQQPVSVTVAGGQTATVSFTATGDGLTYKWYYKNKGASSFTRTTTFSGNTYTAQMNASRDGRQIYCVVTDKYGNSVKTDVVTISMKSSLTITKQPVSVTVANGQTATISFTATGEGLTYKWYYKNKGASTFTRTTTFSGNTYTALMNASRSGRQIYCVVTDKYGSSVKTDVVTLSMAAVSIKAQPVSVTANAGSTARVSFTAVGEGLTYKWYYANQGSDTFTLTKTFTSNVYAVQMNAARAGRRVYCVVTDKYGNSVQTETVTLNMGTPLVITSQPKSVAVASGANAKVTVGVQGTGLTYRWYYADAGSDTFKLTTTFRGSSYTVAMNTARNGRRLYCVITDQFGNSVTTNIVTISMK